MKNDSFTSKNQKGSKSAVQVGKVAQINFLPKLIIPLNIPVLGTKLLPNSSILLIANPPHFQGIS
jgi:hypothetical protein